MPRYVALLRGVSPVNARMSDLRACFESIGFSEVRTILSSGNVVFTTATKKESSLGRGIEAGIEKCLGRSFPVIVRSSDHLNALLKADPFAGFRIAPEAKRVVTFLGQPCRDQLTFPIELDGARILGMKDSEVFTAYVPHARGPVFMTLIEKTFGKNVTTRTWDTIRKCAVA